MSDLYDDGDWRDEAVMDAAGYEEQPTGPDGRYIRDRLMPEFWERFARKARDYNTKDGFEPHRVLGIAGQFAEVWRKVFKLKKAMWDKEPLIHEQPREVLMDMIGHCYLAIAMIDAGPQTEPVAVPGRAPKTNAMGIIPDTLWPNCGRERCINHPKVPYQELLESGVTIYPGAPSPGTVQTVMNPETGKYEGHHG